MTRENESGRRVVCAAIRADDGELLIGIRHYSADMNTQIFHRADGGKFWDRHDPDQGFVDQWGVYMTREQAFTVARDNGQIIRPEGLGCRIEDATQLYSEALY